MAINAIGNGIPFPRGEGIPSAVRDNMVLWYDLKRQGATNESMAANPKLIDLSGNGHDATCYNFAWSGMSGIGGYNQINFNWQGIIKSGEGWKYVTSAAIYNKVPFKIKITCEEPTEKVRLFAVDKNNENITALYYIDINKIVTIPELEIDSTIYNKIYLNLNAYVGKYIIIEQIPEYPNALVFDGVDDYTLTENLPLLNDFTIIAKRKFINTDYHCVASASKTLNIGPFIFEVSNISNSSVLYPYAMLNSFGYPSTILLNNDDITFMTPQYYNNTRINKGNNNETDYLVLGARNVPEYNNRWLNGAIYSFILFNKTLTTKEINWVKRNLIEGDTEL